MVHGTVTLSWILDSARPWHMLVKALYLQTGSWILFGASGHNLCVESVGTLIRLGSNDRSVAVICRKKGSDDDAQGQVRWTHKTDVLVVKSGLTYPNTTVINTNGVSSNHRSRALLPSNVLYPFAPLLFRTSRSLDFVEVVFV